MDKRRKDDVSLLELTMHVADMDEQVQNQNKDIKEMKKAVNTLITEVKVINTRLFVDNGQPSIITQFRAHDKELSYKMEAVTKKLDTHLTETKVRDSLKTGEKKNKKDWIKWGIASLIALFALLNSFGVFNIPKTP